MSDHDTESASAIVLTGGRSSRLGRHKPIETVGGVTMLDAVLDAAGFASVVVVGSDEGVAGRVPVVADQVPGGGPVVGIASGLDRLRSNGDLGNGSVVFVLAADQPFLTGDDLDRLRAARRSQGADVALFVDSSGRRQSLCALWRAGSLQRALEQVGEHRGAAVGELLRGSHVVEVNDGRGATFDVDTEHDLEAARDRASGRGAQIWRETPSQ